MKRFFNKASRPTKVEKELVTEITALVREAELENDMTLLDAFGKTEMSRDEMGLRKILSAIKFTHGNSSYSGNGNNNNNDLKRGTGMSNQNSNSVDSTDDNIAFEPMIDIASQSQFVPPLVHREDLRKQFAHGLEEDVVTPQYPNDGSGEDEIEEPEFEEPGSGGDSEEGGDGGGGNLKDMPPETKRKAIKKSAEIIAKAWTTIIPKLGKYIAEVSPSKVQKMALAREIDPNMELFDGKNTTTVAQVFEDHNQKVNEIMVITPVMEDEFREALKDVLEEKQVAMTPTQRLMSVAAAQIFTILGSAAEMKYMMYQQMKDFKQFHRDNMEKSEREYNERNPQQQQQPQPKTPPPPPVDGNKIKTETPIQNQNTTPEDDEHLMTIDPDNIQVN